MALRAQSTGPSCKLNNAAVSTDMYRVSGQTQTSSSRTRFLYLPIFLLPSILMFYRPIFSSSVGLLPWSYSLYTGIVIREYLRVADIDSQQLHSHYLYSVTRNRTGKIFPYWISRSWNSFYSISTKVQFAKKKNNRELNLKSPYLIINFLFIWTCC